MKAITFIFILWIVFLLSFPPSRAGEEESGHPEFVLLLDYAGNEIIPGGTAPYSPKNTCGACHDYDEITMAYHFQQGRCDSCGKLLVDDDMDSKKPWIISHGMYGKW